MRQLTIKEEKGIKGGEALTIALVCAVMATSIFIIVGWKMYQSTKGSIQIPGGFKFSWSAVKLGISNIFRK